MLSKPEKIGILNNTESWILDYRWTLETEVVALPPKTVDSHHNVFTCLYVKYMYV